MMLTVDCESAEIPLPSSRPDAVGMLAELLCVPCWVPSSVQMVNATDVAPELTSTLHLYQVAVESVAIVDEVVTVELLLVFPTAAPVDGISIQAPSTGAPEELSRNPRRIVVLVSVSMRRMASKFSLPARSMGVDALNRAPPVLAPAAETNRRMP